MAFSDPKNPTDYLRRLLKNMHHGKVPSVKTLANKGFTVREIELLTGISKSSVSRELNG